MLATIIIPTYNNSSLLEKTIISITKQDIDLNEIEVLICDDGSTDNTKDITSKYKDKLNIKYYFQEDKGFRAAAARNMGIKNASSDLCIFIDTGILLSSSAIRNHFETHQNSAEDIALNGYIYGFDDFSVYDDILLNHMEIDDIDKTIMKVKKQGVVDTREKIYSELGDDLDSWPAPWVVCWSGNLSVKTSVLKKVGMFDEYYNSWGGEDTDLALALFVNKIKFVLNRDCSGIEYPNKKISSRKTDPDFAQKEFEKKRDYMNEKYNLTSIKVWYEYNYEQLNRELLNRQQNRVSIIWDVTRYCVWNCKICCSSAIYTKTHKQVNEDCNPEFHYDNELNLSQKKKVIDSLEPGKYRIDFSGGEVMLDAANIELIKYSASKLGKDSIGISTSGVFLTKENLEILSRSVSDVELTLDCVPLHHYPLRPRGYHEYASYGIKRLQEYGISVGIQTVLTNDNKSKDKLDEIYSWVKDNNIDTWSLLRYFPSGRGVKRSDCVVSYEETHSIVGYLKEITEDNKNLDMQFHYLLPNHPKHTYDCRCVKRSIGILPNGKVVSCFWALDENMEAKEDEFILGDVPESTIGEILASAKSKYWSDGVHKCKIFSPEESLQQIS